MGTVGRHVTLVDAYPHMYTGTARSAHLLAQHLPAHGYSAEVLLVGPGEVADRLRAGGAPFHIEPVPPALGHYGRSTRRLRAVRAALALPGFWWRMRRHLRRRPGVVHVTSHRSVVLAAPAGRLARVPVVWQISGLETDRWVSRLCDLVATTTMANSAASTVSLPRRRRSALAVVPPPLDPRFDDPPPVVDADEPIIVTSGRLEPVKGHDLLLDAFTVVRRSVPRARLRIIGGEQIGHEDFAATVRHRAAEVGGVEITGWAERPEELWRDAAVYVNPSRSEGFGLAIVEAMACGLPVVFTEDTGLADFIEPGRDALVVAPAPDAIAVAITSLLADPSRAAVMAAAGRVAARQFRADVVAGKMAAVFDEARA